MSIEQEEATDARRVVLFDFDGVLIHGDSFGMFMRDRYARAWWRKALALLAAPYLLLVLPFSWRRAIRLLVRIALLGIGENRYRVLAAAFAAQLVHRPRQFCRDGVHRLRAHLAAGDRVIIVTGCEDALVRGVLEGLALAHVEVLASHLRPGWLGMRPALHNVGRAKVASLARHGVEAWQVAYSDSGQDMPMLAPAVEAVLVNASPRLCKRVETALGRGVTRVEWY